MTHSVYDALLNSNAVIEFDPQGYILWANRNYLNIMGYELEEIVGQHHSMFLPEKSQHELSYQQMWYQLAQGQTQVGEFKRVTKNNKEVWIQGSYTPVRHPSGYVIKIIKMVIDITEKKRLAENLEKKNRELASTAEKAKAATYAKSVFLANMSHEIRTPLNSIIGITDTLAETKLDNQQASFVEILQRANNQLMTIINDVLDLSKVEAGELELKMLPFQLQKLLDELTSVLGFRAREKALKLSIEVDPDVDSFYIGDADRLRQILMNLLNNAIKFTHGGEISLRVTRNRTSRPGNVLFCVADTGIGIAKSKFKDIFQPFTQADPTTTRRYGGTGLGLSITKNIVEMMQGQIWLESEVGMGSVFYFTATLKPTQERINYFPQPVYSRLTNDNKASFAAERLKILIVDDVDDNRALFGIYLQNTIHSLSYAASGVEAVERVQNEHFDIIFMDVQMPEMDGYEATRRIRAMEKEYHRPPTRIFACTANAFAEDVKKSLQAGCDKHLSKPIRKDTLLKTILLSFTEQEMAY
ncbi:MAG: histidine kinase [Bdellovibrio sp. ArHS]|uniref:PAS domain-containing hybrid sensor histidine kinase/response regulator n=1 Tax=Bdellovibrio sp. ArHS TaxID=1569284 RepID=UPI0005838D35|nr:PAS domain-containing sensor histidine kinase [Bdellovibrio sp. ArHS]KHD88636.1 MAG: histidine kinase [Bdellovibrio sp. ArHS]